MMMMMMTMTTMIAVLMTMMTTTKIDNNLARLVRRFLLLEFRFLAELLGANLSKRI